MNTILKVTLAITLFASTMLADGQMGSGGCNGENCPPPPPPCTENCSGRPEIQGDDDGVIGESKDETVTPADIMRELAEYYFLGF